MRAPLAILSLLLLLPPGCGTSGRNGAVRATGVEPLREADFDEFANRLADQIGALITKHRYWPPAIITVPRVDQGGAEQPEVARAFARRLGEGLSDRLGGSAFFVHSSIAVPDLRSSIRFVAHPRDTDERTIVFRLIDYDSREELLCRRFAYRPFRPEPIARRKRARPGELAIDAEPAEIGRIAKLHAAKLSGRTIVGDVGRVMFLDHKAWNRLWLRSQRATRAADNLLRVELDLRARRTPRDALLRLIFYDERDKPLSATPVIPCHFLPETSRTMAIVSAGSRAAQYVCLIADN